MSPATSSQPAFEMLNGRLYWWFAMVMLRAPSF